MSLVKSKSLTPVSMTPVSKILENIVKEISKND